MGPKPEVIGPNFTKLQASQAEEPKKAKYSNTKAHPSKTRTKRNLIIRFLYQNKLSQNQNKQNKQNMKEIRV